MSRPKRYRSGTVNRTLSLSSDAAEVLDLYAAEAHVSRSEAASRLIMGVNGESPALFDKPGLAQIDEGPVA